MTYETNSPRIPRISMSPQADSTSVGRPAAMIVAALFIAALFVAALSMTGVARAQDAAALRAAEDAAIKSAATAVAPSVLRIETFGGLERVGDQVVSTGPTSGLVVSADGFVLSSAFNFVQNPSSILVTLPSGKRASAEIAARDDSRMLVLLKVNTDESLVVPEFVPRGEITVGQWSLAVGKTFDPERPNISVGIVSAPGRIWNKAIQTDAKVSPSNYGGPLVDIRGRVIGVLVPMSPQAGDGGGLAALAGSEWYDSGIGFAVPVVDLLPHLDAMKQGKSLQPGLLGVRLKGDNVFADPADIAVVQANSPAFASGLKKADRIVEANGTPIARQSELKHVLGPLYAGEVLKLVVARGDERLPFDVTLADHIDPYEHPWIGILPMRDPPAADAEAGKAGIVVRYVFDGSPAAEAGIKAGDKLASVGGQPVNDRASLVELLASHDREKPLALSIERGGEALSMEIKLATLESTTPDDLPPAHANAPAAADANGPQTGLIDIEIPEEKNKCVAYVPENYSADVPHALVVWLHSSGGYKREEILERWRTLSARDHAVVLAPASADPSRWTPTEMDFVRKTIEAAIDRFAIDRTRVVVYGNQAGGAMAYLAAFTQTELVRGLAVVDAPAPRLVRPPDTDPLNRLMVYSVTPKESKGAEAIGKTMERLRELKFPVQEKQIDGPPRDLGAADLAELMRWIDSLDRI